MTDQAPQPVAKPKRVPSRGKKKRGWGCYEWLVLRFHVVCSTALIVMAFAGDVIQNDDLRHVAEARGPNYVLCWTIMNAVVAAFLKYRDNRDKQA